MIKLWLDDLREAPEGWVWAKDGDEAKEIFLNENVVEASLDHDLGGYCYLGFDPWFIIPEDETKETGYDLLKWIAENNLWPDEALSVHSANPVGAKNMSALIDSQGPYTVKFQFERHEPEYVEGWLWLKS